MAIALKYGTMFVLLFIIFYMFMANYEYFIRTKEFFYENRIIDPDNMTDEQNREHDKIHNECFKYWWVKWLTKSRNRKTNK